MQISDIFPEGIYNSVEMEGQCCVTGTATIILSV
jgi:hypothetical protein